MSRPGSFWARRKARVEAEAAEDARRAEEARADAVAQDLAEKSDEDILAEYGLPDPDDLVPGDGIAGFMRREIPERLRRRAMRKLWRSNPVLACVDGLNDYDDDYTNAATDMPGVKTAYQIGKGMKAHVEALAAEEEAKQKLQPSPRRLWRTAPRPTRLLSPKRAPCPKQTPCPMSARRLIRQPSRHRPAMLHLQKPLKFPRKTNGLRLKSQTFPMGPPKHRRIQLRKVRTGRAGCDSDSRRPDDTGCQG